jgi:hypothetical protein
MLLQDSYEPTTLVVRERWFRDTIFLTEGLFLFRKVRFRDLKVGVRGELFSEAIGFRDQSGGPVDSGSTSCCDQAAVEVEGCWPKAVAWVKAETRGGVGDTDF